MPRLVVVILAGCAVLGAVPALADPGIGVDSRQLDHGAVVSVSAGAGLSIYGDFAAPTEVLANGCLELDAGAGIGVGFGALLLRGRLSAATLPLVEERVLSGAVNIGLLRHDRVPLLGTEIVGGWDVGVSHVRHPERDLGIWGLGVGGSIGVPIRRDADGMLLVDFRAHATLAARDALAALFLGDVKMGDMTLGLTWLRK